MKPHLSLGLLGVGHQPSRLHRVDNDPTRFEITSTNDWSERVFDLSDSDPLPMPVGSALQNFQRTVNKRRKKNKQARRARKRNRR